MVKADLLQQAATQAKTGWLEKALLTLLPQIWNLTPESPHWEEAASAWATQIDRLFEEHKLRTPNQQKNRRTDIANALRTIDLHHPVIPFILLPASVYTALNNEQANRLNTRENKVFSVQQADELVNRAIALLDREDPNEVAAGLAVLVGRRSGELLISQFKPKTAFSLLFSEAVKRRETAGLEFEIPTLAPAARVLEAIDHLKRVWNIEDLKALDLATNHLKRRINARYAGVPQACRQHYADLIPGREADTDTGERLYTHLFRAVYTEIATYYYKPAWVPDHRFKAEIQGHFKFTEDGQKIPNYSARQNYDDYLIRDRSPSEPGVQLGRPGVEILEVFQKERPMEQQMEQQMEAPEEAINRRQLQSGTINALLYRTVDRLLFSKHWAETVTGLVLVTGRGINTLLKSRPAPHTQFSVWIDGMEVPTLTMAPQVISAWNKFVQVSLLLGSHWEVAIREVCDRTFKDLAPIQTVADLQAVYSAICLHWFCPPDLEETTFLKSIRAADPGDFETMDRSRGVKLKQPPVQVSEPLPLLEAEAMPQETPEALEPEAAPPPRSRPRRKTVSVDAGLLKAAAQRLGLTIRGKGGAGGLSYEAALTEVLSQLVQEQAPPSAPSPSPASPGEDKSVVAAMKDQARTLAWFTTRLETLEQQVAALQQERDEALAQVASAEERTQLEHLHQENERLKRDRDLAIRKLETFRRLLTGTELEEEEENDDRTNPPELQPTPLPPPEPEPPKVPRIRLPEEDALHHIRRAVRAIMAFNNHDDRAFDEKWYISFPVVQTLLRANGLSANQKNVATVFEEMHSEMEQHHDFHRMGSRHNRRHPNLERIAEQVTLDDQE